MKYLAIIGLLFLSSCTYCGFGGGDDMEVDKETLEWLLPYESEEYFVFEDEQGGRDSLEVERTSNIESCGGDECSVTCEIEIATLQSIFNPEILFSTIINSSSSVSFNADYSRDQYIFFTFLTTRDYTFVSEKFSLIRRTDYFRIDCKNNANCSGYPMKGFIFTKQEGLIEYTTADNKKWMKVN